MALRGPAERFGKVCLSSKRNTLATAPRYPRTSADQIRVAKVRRRESNFFLNTTTYLRAFQRLGPQELFRSVLFGPHSQDASAPEPNGPRWHRGHCRPTAPRALKRTPSRTPSHHERPSTARRSGLQLLLSRRFCATTGFPRTQVGSASKHNRRSHRDSGKLARLVPCRDDERTPKGASTAECGTLGGV